MQVTLPNGEIFTTEQLTAAMDNWYRNGISLNDPRVLNFFNYAGLSNEFFAQAAANTAYEKNQSAQEAEKAEAARLEAQRVEAARLEAQKAEAAEAARLEAQKAEAVRLEAARLEAEKAEAARLEAQKAEAARLEAARAEAARVEAARIAALPKYTTSVGSTYTTDDVRNLLNFFDSVKIPLTDPQAQSVLSLLPESFVQLVRPTYKAPEPPAPTTGIANDLMYRSMTSGVSSSLFDKYGGYEKVKAASTLGATPKDIADYERAMGLPESEYTRVNKEYAASGKSKDTIISEITALIPTSGSITYETLVNYANKNNLSFQSVANALEGKFKNVTPAQILSNLNYEDDRLILNSLAKKQTVNGKEISSVDLSDAIIAASQGKVTPENLAKFFGKTPTEMASLVSSNLDFIADKLRDNGIDPSRSLSSMFGVAAEKVVESIKTTDIKEGLNALAGTDGKIGFDAAIKYASEKGLSNDQLASYLGVTPKAITDYVADKDIRSGLDALAGTDGKISFDAAINYAKTKGLSNDQLAGYLGVTPKTITDYSANRDIKSGINALAGTDGKISFDEALDYARTNNLSNDQLATYLGITPKAIADYVTDKNIRSGLNAAAGTDGKISYDEALDFAGNNYITIEQLASYLGVAPKVLSDYDTSRQIKTGIERVAGQDNQLSFLDIIGFAETNKLNLEDVVNHIGNPSTKDKLLSDLKAYKSDLASGKTPTDQLVYTTEGLADAYQLVSNMSPAAQKLAALAQNALQNPTIENKKALYSAYKTNVTSDDLNQAEQYIAKLTGGNATITNLASSYMFDPNINVPEVVKEPVTLDQGTSTNQYKYISEHISDVLKNPNATVSQKVDYINQFAAENNLSRQELSAITGYSLQDVNDFLDAKPVEQQQSKVVTDLIALADKDGRIGLDTALNYASENNVKIEELATLINVPLETLTKYKTDTAIISGLEAASGEDKQLSYSEIVDFASKNNMDLSNVVNYIGTEDKRSDLLTSLQDYVKEEGFKTSLSDTKLTDYKGNQYAANDLLKLADQVKQNFDTENSSGGVYKTSGESVGFDYSEAKKLFPEGKNPTVFDQVALDIARGLLKAGIKDVSELSKYKPTEVQVPTTYKGIPIPDFSDVYNGDQGVLTASDQLRQWKASVDDQVGEYTGKEQTRPVTVFMDPKTGEEAPAIDLGATYTGKGGTLYHVGRDETGKPVFSTSYTETSDKQAIATLVAIGAAILAPQILPQLIGAAPAAVAGVEGAVAQAALGGTGLTGSLMAAGVPASVAGYAATAIVNGVYNGVVAEATGGDFEKAFITGGVAPVIGQLTTNAVNSITTGLPAGVSNAVGNAVSQLISTGEIDLGQVALAGVRPAVINTIVNASGGSLTVPQARLLLDTVASGGKNITSLAQNPAGVVNFVLKNQDAFKSLSTAAATNTAQKPPNLDLSSLDTVQKEVLTSQPRTETIQGEALFQDINTTELGTDLAKTGIVRPPGEIISTDLSKPVTGVDEFARYDDAIKFAQALISGDPSALAKMAGTAGEDTGVGQLSNKDAIAQIREAQRTGALDYYNLSQAQLEAMLIDRAPTLEQAREMAELAYGKGASFSYGGKFYEGEQGKTVLKDAQGNEYRISKEATLITNAQGGVTGYTLNGKSYDYKGNEISTKAPTVGVEIPGSTNVPYARAPNGMYTLQGFLAAGGGKDAEDYRSYVIAANELINKTGTAKELNPSAYNIASARASDMSTRAGIVSASAAYTQPTQAPLSSLSAAGSPYLAGLGHMAMAVGGTGATFVEGVLRGLNQTEAAERVGEASRDAFFAARNIAATSPDAEKTLAVSSGVLSGVSILLSGGTAWSSAIAPTIVAMNDTFRDGQVRGLSDVDNLTRTLGSGVAEYIGEWVGNKFLLSSVKGATPGTSVAIRDSLVDGYASLPANASKQQIKDMVGTWAKINGVEQVAEGVTTALQIANDKIHGITDTTPKNAQELAELVASQMEIVFGATNIALGLGGGAYAASRAANQGVITIEYADEISRKGFDKTIEDILDVTPVLQTVGLLTGPDNKPITNNQGQPILLESIANQPTATVVGDDKGPVNNEFSISLPTETIFDLVFDNESQGYTVNSVNLDGNKFNVTMADGSKNTIDAAQIHNNALNLLTQSDPAAIATLQSSGDLSAFLSTKLAESINVNALNGPIDIGTVVSSNDKGSIFITNNGTLAFVPLSSVSSPTSLSPGSQVVMGDGVATQVQKTIDEKGFQQYVPVMDSSTLSTVQMPSYVLLNTAMGQTTINKANPDVLIGTVQSIDLLNQTALVATGTGNPQIVSTTGTEPIVGGDLFFNGATGNAYGTPIKLEPEAGVGAGGGVQPPSGGKPVDLVDPNGGFPSGYTPIGTVPAPITSDPIQNIPSGVITPPSEVPPSEFPPADLVPPGGVPPIDLGPPTGGVPPVDLQIPTVGVPDTTIKTGGVPTGGVSVVTAPSVITIPPVVTPPPWGLPVVPPPELSGSFQMPYPNYLRPLDPYLGYGIGALMGDLYDEVSRDGRYQPFQNAQGEIKIPT